MVGGLRASGLRHIMMDVHGRENPPTSWPGLKPLFRSIYSVTCERPRRPASQPCPPPRGAAPLATPWTAAVERQDLSMVNTIAKAL